MNRLTRFDQALTTLPTSGGGGCHAALLGRANLGLAAGLTPDQVFQHLRASVRGSRHVPDREIMAAVRRAEADAPTFTGTRPRWTPKPTRPAFDGPAARARIIERGASVTEAELWEASPIRVDWPPEQDAAHLLMALYAPQDVLFIGERADTGPRHVHTVAGWLRDPAGLAQHPHIIPNPLTGQTGQTKDGKPSLRADACVQLHRYAVVEFDSLPREEQIAFFAGVDLPLAALIDSGGKSVHGWLRVDMPDAATWDAQVRPLYRTRLVPMGVDGACANPARLSRLPGHHRREKDRWQRILFLDPSARGPRHYLKGGAK